MLGLLVFGGLWGAVACLPHRIPPPPPPPPPQALPPPELPEIPEDTPPVQLPLHPQLRIRAVGDVMLGTDFPEGYLPPQDMNVLQGVKELLQGAEVVFANLEGPLCDGGESTKCGPGGRCYAFRMPGRYVHHLKEAGINVVSTANNHSGDFGEECSRQTEAFLDSVGIAWSGPPGSMAFLQHHGRRVAVLAFHTSPRTNNLNDLPAALALLAQAKKQAHWVVVSFHGGAEGAAATRVAQGREMFLKENRGDLRLFARSMVEAGADVVLGHGPHVLRGMELWKGKLIAYSLGNFATYGRFGLAGPLGVGAVLEVVLDEEGHFVEGQLFSTQQEGKGIVQADAQGKAFGAVRELSMLDFPKTGIGVGLDGKLFKEPLRALPSMRLCATLWPCSFAEGCVAPACEVFDHLEAAPTPPTPPPPPKHRAPKTKHKGKHVSKT